MAMWSRVGGAVQHNLWDVMENDAKKLVAQSEKKTIRANYSNSAENWQGDFSNNGLFTSMREKFLTDPNSPRYVKSRKGQKEGDIKALTETQQGVANRYAGFRGNLRQARDNMKGNLANLEGRLDAAQKMNDKEQVEALQAAMSGQRKDMSKLGTQEMMSYVQQAGGHMARTLKWSQEGSGMDRLKKTAFVGGVYGGANVGLRGLSGGGATYNNDGERDIAGLPFL
jgi:hypothetical protein